jgi:hypothetical protein
LGFFLEGGQLQALLSATTRIVGTTF